MCYIDILLLCCLWLHIQINDELLDLILQGLARLKIRLEVELADFVSGGHPGLLVDVNVNAHEHGQLVGTEVGNGEAPTANDNEEICSTLASCKRWEAHCLKTMKWSGTQSAGPTSSRTR